MATELAKAYVQIIPSAEGMSDKLKKLLEKNQHDAGKHAGDSFGKSLISTAKKALAAAGIGKPYQRLSPKEQLWSRVSAVLRLCSKTARIR